MNEKKNRNKLLVALRKLNPEYWSYRRLGAFFDINFKTAESVFKRKKDIYRFGFDFFNDQEFLDYAYKKLSNLDEVKAFG